MARVTTRAHCKLVAYPFKNCYLIVLPVFKFVASFDICVKNLSKPCKPFE